MATKTLPDQATLRERFHYDEISGALIWRVRPRSDFQDGRAHKRWNTQFAGSRAGTINQQSPDGPIYWRLKFEGRDHLQHRLIFVWVTGEAPKLVDHRDTNGLNNAWTNLRPATQSGNASNSAGHKKKRSGLPKGVQPNGLGWSAKIMANGISHHLGTFASPEKAHAAYCEAATRLHGEFANFGEDRQSFSP